MAVKVIKPPQNEPLTLEEAKLHLRIDTDEEDGIIKGLIKQSREWCEAYQNRKYLKQTLEIILDEFPKERYIEFKNTSPILEVEYIRYIDKEGMEYDFKADNYIIDKDSFISRIVLKDEKSWPGIKLQAISGVRIRILAGCETEVDESVKWAMILHMRLLYDDLKTEERIKLQETRNAILGMNRVIPI